MPPANNTRETDRSHIPPTESIDEAGKRLFNNESIDDAGERLFPKQEKKRQSIYLSVFEKEPLSIDPKHTYANTPHFQEILDRARKGGLESLSTPEQQQIQSALKYGVITQEHLSGQPQLHKRTADTLDALGEATKNLLRSADPDTVRQIGPPILQGLKSLDQYLYRSADQAGKQLTGGRLPEKLQDFFLKVGLQPISEAETVTGTTVEALVQNTVKGAWRLLPELSVQLLDNPYEFVKGFATFPFEELNLMMEAWTGHQVKVGRFRSYPTIEFEEVSDDDIQAAQQEIVKNPLGVLMLGAMTMGAVGRGRNAKQPKFATVSIDRLNRSLEHARASREALADPVALARQREVEPVTMGAEDVGKPLPESASKVAAEPVADLITRAEAETIAQSPKPIQLYRETSIDRVEEFLPNARTSISKSGDRVDLAESPEKAIGISEHRGVLLEFTDDGIERVQGREGGSEFPTNQTPQNLSDRLRSVTILKDAIGNKAQALELRDRLNDLVAQGWTKETLPEGDVKYIRKSTREAQSPPNVLDLTPNASGSPNVELRASGLSPEAITEGIVARKLRQARRDRSESGELDPPRDPEMIGGDVDLPSIRVLQQPADVGITSAIQTPQGVLHAAPDLPAKYGEAAKRAGEEILFTETQIMVEAGTRAEQIEGMLHKVDKTDWGKAGETFYDHVVDPARDAELKPTSREAAQELRSFMERDRREIVATKRDMLRPSVKRMVEREYRQQQNLRPDEPIGTEGPARTEVSRRVDDLVAAKIPDDWGIQNYLPQFHPGAWEVLRDGEYIGSASTPFQAKLRAIEDYASHPELSPESYTVQGRAFRGADVVRTTRRRFYRLVNSIAFAAENSVSPEQVAAFLRGTIGTKEAKQKYANFLQKREGFAGFSKDLPRVLGLYNQQYVRWKHLSELNKNVQPMIEKIRREQRPQTADYVDAMLKHLWGPAPTKATAMLDNSIARMPGARDVVKPLALMRWLGFIKRRTADLFLRFSPRFHAINRLQRFQTTEPLLTLEESIEGRKFYHSAEGKAKLHEFGIRHLTGGKTIEGVSPRLGTLTTDVKLAATREKMRGFAPETSNQQIVWSQFFVKGKARGMSDTEANRYAILQGNIYSQFLALRSDTPMIMRGPVTSAIFQFKRFSVKDMEIGIDLIQQKDFPGVSKWLGAKLLLGGAKFATSPKALGMGYLALEAYNEIKEEYGETVANGVAFGLPGLVGLDLSYSFQMVNMPTGDSFAEQVGNFVLPPLATTGVRVYQATEEAGTSQSKGELALSALGETIPSLRFISSLRAWGEGLDRGEYNFRTPDGRLKFKSDFRDLLTRAGGFRTTEEGVSRLTIDGFTELAAERDEILDRAARNMYQTLLADEELDRQRVFSEVLDWNEGRPEVPIAMDAILKRLGSVASSKDRPTLERKLKGLGSNFYQWWLQMERNAPANQEGQQ